MASLSKEHTSDTGCAMVSESPRADVSAGSHSATTAQASCAQTQRFFLLALMERETIAVRIVGEAALAARAFHYVGDGHAQS